MEELWPESVWYSGREPEGRLMYASMCQTWMFPLYRPEYTLEPCTAIAYTACESPSSDAVFTIEPGAAWPSTDTGLPGG